MTYRFLPEAKADLLVALDFYDSASPGLGARFLGEMDAAIARVLRHPEAWTQVTESHRRCRLRRFPYGLMYSIQGEEILIAAVFHLHRKPEPWG